MRHEHCVCLETGPLQRSMVAGSRRRDTHLIEDVIGSDVDQHISPPHQLLGLRRRHALQLHGHAPAAA
jgi:hypothetical protein